MIESYYRNNITDETHFGGLIYLSDFDTERPGTHNIASRIASDIKFEERCKKCAEIRKAKHSGSDLNDNKE